MPNSTTLRSEIRLQAWLVGLGVLLMGGKLLAWQLTGSHAILSDAAESLVNVLAGSFTWYSLVLSARPRDLNHPYGHGKIEFLAAGIEGALLALAGLLIVANAAVGLFEKHELKSLDWGLGITATAGAINFGLGSWARKRAAQTLSMPLEAGGKHLQADGYTTAGLLIGLGLVWLTGWNWLDALVALLFGLFLCYTAWGILQPSLAGIMDEADEQLLGRIAKVLEHNRQDDWVDFHNMRMIRYGRMLHIDAHLTLPRYYDVEQAHAAMDHIDQLVTAEFGRQMEFFIHVDPCLPSGCGICAKADCPVRSTAFTRHIKWELPLLMQNKKHQS
ncbi:MAG: cation diffusion facilitator family transporter [Sphingobacteriaceae bacterium]|nr:cation diffusion facilitator family transporter [Sphingobacteriaceae bacterium]